MKLSTIVLLTMVPASVLFASIQPGAAQNLNQKYGPGWDCGSITAVPQYEGEYRACKKCEDAGQDFYRTSDSSGYCVAKGGGASADSSEAARTEEPVEPNLPAVIPISPKSDISSKDYFVHPYTESTKSSEEALAKARADAEAEKKAVEFLAQAERSFRAKDWIDAADMYGNAEVYTLTVNERTANQKKRISYAKTMAEISNCHFNLDGAINRPENPGYMKGLQKCKKFDFVRKFLERQ
jgi:hypothetical protein